MLSESQPSASHDCLEERGDNDDDDDDNIMTMMMTMMMMMTMTMTMTMMMMMMMMHLPKYDFPPFGHCRFETLKTQKLFKSI